MYALERADLDKGETCGKSQTEEGGRADMAKEMLSNLTRYTRVLQPPFGIQKPKEKRKTKNMYVKVPISISIM